MPPYLPLRHSLLRALAVVLVGALGACGGGDRNAGASDSAAPPMTRADSVAAITSAPPAAGTTTMANATLDDASVVQLIVAIDRAEAAGGRLASTKATQADVKAYGRMILQEHDADLSRIRQLATANRIALDTSSTTRGPGDVPAAAGGASNAVIIQLEQNQQQTFGQLQVATGPDFGRAYVASLLAGHQQVIDLLRVNESRFTTPAIREHVTTLSATMAKHLARAKQLQQEIGGDGAATTGR